MDANAVPLLTIFEKKMRMEVPLFQRQYVWNEDEQWEPLWEDISRKFSEYLEGRTDAPVHFLGAMVIDQKQTPTTHVEKRQVIDGQQRLTTLQIFLAAFRDFCGEQDCTELAGEVESFTLNKGMMANPEIDRFKVWPTQLDRAQFIDVLTSGSRTKLEERYPFKYKKYARKPEPRPRMVDAYLFFHSQLTEFFCGSATDEAICSSVPMPQRLEECFSALKNSLKVVVIDLQPGDDAQVIFETLNARGQPLLPADLLRNFIFLRAARLGENQEMLYEKYWRSFDEEFWRVQVKQGRLLRPRSDLFMQHFLASRQGVDIPVKHLFVEYKFWIDRQRPFKTVEDELITLARQGQDFKRLIDPVIGDRIHDLAKFLDAFDVRTCYPLVLALLDIGMSDQEWSRLTRGLQSYLLRRAVCNQTTKNYNRVFLTLARSLRKGELGPAQMVDALKVLDGESTEWPSDAAFRDAWMSKPVYEILNNPKLVWILSQLSHAYFGGKSEQLSIDSALSVEHLLPQEWTEHWPLADGSKGLDRYEIWAAAPTDPLLSPSRDRHACVHTMGNLTILTQPLNSSVSNSGWDVKKPQLLEHSLLPINKQLYGVDVWNEEAIAQRGADLFERALTLWPRG
jgi:hypothetical protein